MPLRDFLSEHRTEILAGTLPRLKEASPQLDGPDLVYSIDAFLDEIEGALRRDAGQAATSPLPSASMAAMEHGRQRQRLGCAIDVVPKDFGAICDATLKLALEYGVTFAAADYKALNLAIDAGIASAVQEFWHESELRTTKQVGSFAHELRNALATATMAFAAIKSGQVGAQSGTAAALERSLARMQDLISKTAAAVLLQAEGPIEYERVRVADLLRTVTGDAVFARGITARIEVSEDVELDGDRRLLSSALSNLVQNAIKFSRDGACVRVRARREGDVATIGVEDECGGLPNGQQAELFKPFVKRGGNRSGLGLGLSIAHDAAAAHHGELAVTNLPGKGCVFTLKLPITSSR
jgi:signal transduction histidine kinase